MKSLTVLIPYYNESRTLPRLFAELKKLPSGVVAEYVFVDDGSTDDSYSIVESFLPEADLNIVSIKDKENQGKGSAIKNGLSHTSSEYCLILDADMELSPSEIPALFAPIENLEAEVVFGYRRFTSQSSFTYRYVLGNKLITHTFGFLFNIYLNDIMCGFKLLPTELWKKLNLHQHGFAVEVEIPAKCLKYGFRPFEIPVAYKPRTRLEGKGITALDGVKILFKIFMLRVKFCKKTIK